jgi:hypothetical protein
MMSFLKGKNAVKVVVAVVFLAVLFLMLTKSGYVGYPVKTNMPESKFDSLFATALDSKLGPQLKCNPGSADKDGKIMSSYYTGGLMPGGYCDDQAAINSAMSYKLVGKDTPLGE